MDFAERITPLRRNLRVALVHYWLLRMRGGERVLEALCELYPDADIYTHVVDRDQLSPTLKRHEIKTTFIARLPRAKTAYQKYLPLMPIALENLDLSGYDLVISSESGPAKGVLLPTDATHVCYCHSPMRYIWNMYHEYKNSAGLVTRTAMPLLSHYMRMWDLASASRIDRFVANSDNVGQRIRRYYDQDAAVVHPPVDTDAFHPVAPNEIGDFYLMAGELVRYKRPDLAVRTFNRLGKRLVVIGGGEMLPELKAMAGPTVELLGRQPFDVLRDAYAHAKGLIFPGEEDFGIVPVEMMASGRPVIAYGRGGALETVIDGLSGVLFDEQSEDALADAIARAERISFDPGAIVRHASGFGKARFKEQMAAAIEDTLTARRRAVPAQWSYRAAATV